MRVTAAAGHVLNLLLVLRVLAARAFRGLRILLLALGLVLNQPLFDRLLATKGVRIDRLLYELASLGTANVLVLVVVLSVWILRAQTVGAALPCLP